MDKQINDLSDKTLIALNAAPNREEQKVIEDEYNHARTELFNKRMEETKKFKDALKACDQAKEEYAKSCRGFLTLPEGQHSKIGINNYYGKKHDIDWQLGVDWFSSMTNQFGRPEDETTVKMITINRNTRSYHRFGMVYLSRNAKPEVIAHELGHALEFRNSTVHQKCVDFLEERTRGEAGVPLAKLRPHWGYGRGEVAKADKFLDPYMGKLYKNATEILSMGLTYLYTEPALFAKEDPEYFDFMINTLRGQ
jgi:hypothetical protein